MAKFRKAAALLACAVMASSVSGCADTTYSAKYGDETVKAGVYIAYLQSELNNQLYSFSYQGIEPKDYFSQQIDGVDLAEYVKKNAEKDVNEYVAVKKQFEAEGLTLTDEELKSLNTNLNSSWDSMGGMYEYNGVSKESLKELYRESTMRSKLYDKYYGEEGTEAPSAEEMQTFVNDNFIRYKMISIYKSSNSDESAAAAENEEKLKTRDEFYEKGKELGFDNFDTLIDEYNASSSSAADTDSSSEAPADSGTSSDTDSSQTDDTSSVADTSETESTAEESSAAPEAPASESEAAPAPNAAADTPETAAPDSESSAETAESTESVEAADSTETADSAESAVDISSEAEPDSSAADDSTTDSAAEEAAPDPYKNEVMINLFNYEDEDYETASGKLYKFIKDAEVGKVLTFENDNAYYIVVKGDVSARTDYITENRSSVVSSMVSDKWQAKIDGWVAAAGVTFNDKALKRYTPQVIYDRMTEYSQKNAG